MRRATLYLLPFVCLLVMPAVQAQDHTPQPGANPPTTPLSTETANNTSACSANGTPSYCNEALPNLATNSGNQTAGAQTTVVDAFPEHVSTISAHLLMYHNWSGQLLCEYQPWFENTGSFNGHIDIGYNENTLSTVQKQDGTMITRGCNINFVDFYGNVNPGEQFNLTTTNNVYTDVSGRTNLPLKLGILEDQGSFDAKVAPYCGNQSPPLSESATISCIESALESDMTYIYTNYISPKAGVYWMDGGKNVIGYFGACPTFSALHCDHTQTYDWDTIWSAVQSYSDTTAIPRLARGHTRGRSHMPIPLITTRFRTTLRHSIGGAIRRASPATGLRAGTSINSIYSHRHPSPMDKLPSAFSSAASMTATLRGVTGGSLRSNAAKCYSIPRMKSPRADTGAPLTKCPI